MRRYLSAALSALALLASSAANANDRPNVMVMGLDADEHGIETQTVAVARDTRVYTRVIDAITEQLQMAGFDTYDERTVPALSANARSEAVLVGIARAHDRPPMDAVVIFSVYTGARRLAYTTEVYVRIAGRVLNAGTGQRLGAFEVTSPKGWRAPINCERDCLVEAVGKSAKTLAVDLSGMMAEKVALAGTARSAPKIAAPAPKAARAPDAFRLLFAGFTADEIGAAEEYLVAFKGYKSHRAVAADIRRTEYAYEYSDGGSALMRDLRMMLDRIGAQGRVNYSRGEQVFSIARTGIDNEPMSATLTQKP